MTAVIARPIPVVDWSATEDEWLHARSQGLGASSAATVLGFIKWRTPWQVWAEKTNARRPEDGPSTAAELGSDLEPWLLDQATKLLGQRVTQTEHRTYAHPQHRWRLASPDGIAADGRLVEVKTAGLASGYGVAHGWADGSIPLGYEIQARWQMHVMDADVVEVVGLVAGMGVVHRTVRRDLGVEQDMVSQVDEWWQRFVIGGEEPPFELADRETVAFLYPNIAAESKDVDQTAAPELLARRSAAVVRKKLAESEADLIDTQLKSILGDAELARIDGRVAYSWGTRKGSVDWAAYVADLAATVPNLPDPELYRKPPTRSLKVKEL